MSGDRWAAVAVQWGKVREQWQASRRLRLAVLAIVAFAGLHVLDAIETRRLEAVAQYNADLQLRERLQRIAEHPEWIEHADAAESELSVLRRQMLAVASGGQAQAEARGWLTEFAGSVGLSEPSVKVESVLDVPGHEGLQQVLARLDGRLGEFGQAALVRGLAHGLPWVQVEKLDIDPAKTPRVGMVVRFYYRRDAMTATAGPEQESGA